MRQLLGWQLLGWAAPLIDTTAQRSASMRTWSAARAGCWVVDQGVPAGEPRGSNQVGVTEYTNLEACCVIR